MKKQFLIVGGDRRFSYLSEALVKLGYDSTYVTTQDPNISSASIDGLIFPLFPSVKELGRFAPLCKPKAFIGAGLASKDFSLAVQSYEFSFYDYMKDSFVVTQNALATAEAALHVAIGASPNLLANQSCLLIGYGNIGRILAKMLRSLNALVTVYDLDLTARAKSIKNGYPTISSLANCHGYSCIFNTAPYLNLTPKILDTTSEDVAIIDLASAPGGTDLDYAKSIHRNAALYPGLPGKYAPKFSGETLATAIHKRIQALGD